MPSEYFDMQDKLAMSFCGSFQQSLKAAAAEGAWCARHPDMELLLALLS